MKKYFLWTTVAVTTALPGLAGAQIHSERLKELVETKNSRVQASQKLKEAARNREGFLGRSFFPALEMHASQEQFKQGRGESQQQPAYGAELRVNLFNGGKDALENKVRTLGSQKRTYENQRILSEELEKARNDYWQVLYLRDKSGLLNAAIEINKKNLSAADRRIRSGVATESDRVEFEMQAVELERELAETKNKLDASRRSLQVLLGVEKISDSDFTEKLDHEHDYEKVLKHNVGDHDFLFKENEVQSEQSRLQASKENRNFWPKLDVFAAYNQYNQRDKDPALAADRTESVVGVRMTLNISSGLESLQEKSALLKEAEASRHVSEFQKKEVEVHIENEMSELALMHDQVHEAEENIKRAEKYYRLTQSEYARGVKNSPDVLGASEKLFSNRHKRLEIIRDFQLAKAHVLSKIGR